VILPLTTDNVWKDPRMPRHAATEDRRSWRTILTVVVVSQLVVALVTAGVVWAAYNHLNNNINTGPEIQHLDPSTGATPSAGQKGETGPTGDLNILVMGLDTRNCPQPDGTNPCHIDNEPGEGGSDTTILLHISADRKTVYGVSIPRDALVKPVACTKAHLYVNPQGVKTDLVEWNEAYDAGQSEQTNGGPVCTAEQVEGNFGVHVDGYVTVNFAGFIQMVDAVNGVDVCIPRDLDDPTYEKFDFPQSTSYHLDGPTALKYVRLRHVLNGSDTGRIQRQQYFISRLIDKVKSAQVLSSFTSLYSFAKAFTGALTVDPALKDNSNLEKIAWQLRGVDLGHIKFITLPSADYPTDSTYYYRVQILPAAYKLMKRVEADKPLGSYGKGAQSAGHKKHHQTESAKQKAYDVGLCS
jgi:LCP family protein required for cell wall assembly